MHENKTYNEASGSQECQESLQRFRSVVGEILAMTRQLAAGTETDEIDALISTLEERRQLLGVAQTLRDKFVPWKHEQRVSDQLKESVIPLVSELCNADHQLLVTVQQQKHKVVEQLARLHRVHNLERYIR
jgi:thiamine monophosphate kinase